MNGNNEITYKKGRTQPNANETIRNYKLSNGDRQENDGDEGQEQEEQDNLSDDEDQENQDIADVHQWKEVYNQLRHELFDHNQINVLKLLALNKTTKLKHKIVMISSEEDENNYDRSRERELIFKKIKALRVELRIYKENKRSKKLRPEQLQESIDSLEKKFDELKLEQMNIFNSMEKEKAQIEGFLIKIDNKINDGDEYDSDNDSGQDDNDEEDNDTEGKRQGIYNKGEFDSSKGMKKSNNMKLTQVPKQNSQVNLYEVNEVAEEYQDGNESLMTRNERNDGIHSFVKSQTTKNQLEDNRTHLLLDTDEEEEEEYREILEKVGVKYGTEDPHMEEEEEIEETTKTQVKRNNHENSKKITLSRNVSNSNKENISNEINSKKMNKNNSKNGKTLLTENVNNVQNPDSECEEEEENQLKEEDQEENEYDPDEEIMRDELNFQLQQGKKPKTNNEEDKSEMQNITNQIEDMENDLTDLKSNVDLISQQMKILGDRNLGWLQEDHQDFLRVRSKHKNDITSAKFLEECANVIPVHSKEEIEDHAQLYLQYYALDQEKKNTLGRYKDIKEQKTKLEEQLKFSRMKIQEEVLFKKKLKKTKEELMEERLKQKDKIMIWKQNKMSYKDSIVHQEIEEKKILFSLDKEKKVRDDKLREERKLLIKKYQEEKELERKKLKEMDEIQKEREKIKKKVSLQEITRIKAKEETMVRKKQMRVLEMKYLQKEDNDNIQRIQVLNKEKFSYVEPRLQDLTKAAERRATQKFDSLGKVDRFGPSCDSFAGNPLGIGGRLKVPTWRPSNQ